MTKQELPASMHVTKAMNDAAAKLWDGGFNLDDYETACELHFPNFTDDEVTGVGFIMQIYAEFAKQATLKLAAEDPEKIAEMMRQIVDREAPDATRKTKLAILSEVSAEVWPNTYGMKRKGN